MTAFDEIYEMYRTPIYRFACALCGDARDAEDLFQETWLRAVKAAPAGLEGRSGEAKAWLYAIAANAHRDQLRKRRVRRLFLAERAKGLRGREGDADLGWDPPASGREDRACRSDIRLCLRRAVSRLPGRERRVFVLKDVEGFRHDEIGRLLGIPEATVRTLLHRAVKKLRRDLADFGPEAAEKPAFGEGRT
jgi:RNA polymerase sigma-70 factor (ECF subfamily)